ncbi:sirohydrochlorin chelatase [Nocardioides marmoribigeumensis]|uniref:Sirohydrochlorin ferrochelatase n=1 Tax=Nocardioides marmoribigeumensis TaxID=433649 RepID=A0ABU2BZ19_9ACTN|nr:CbiX/SirB N-terminal domain-containing protein [Nocardioides marmoribigeumensis]MDR7363650.1 sirohydrochlorin ferrochelatase [Nocardioides marmoribigeumensis]
MDGSLVLCAHGTRSDTGRAAVQALVQRVADVWPAPVEEAYVDVHGPTLGSVLRPGATVVPLLLSPGFHTEVDIAGAAATVGRVHVTPPLGPSTRLVALLHQRLVVAGVSPGDAVVLAAAGSSRPEAAEAVARTAEDLALLVRRPVTVGYAAPSASSPVPSVPEAVAAARAAGARRVLVASYLLAPGHFQQRLRESGADVVTSPLLHPSRVPDLLVELVLGRAGDTCDNARFLLQWARDQRRRPHAPLLAG